MIDPDEALTLVVEATVPRRRRALPVDDSCGLRLAEEVRADRAYPAFDRAMMDGYAVRVADAGRTVVVTGELAAGGVSPRSFQQGECIEIMTGAICPPRAEAIVPKECAHRSANRVSLPKHIEPGQHIAPRGSECEAGSLVLRPGDVVTPLAVAVMASFGRKEVLVTPRPTVGIIVTGGELVATGAEPAAGQIRDSNGPMLAAMAAELGLDRPAALRVEDKIEAIVEAVRALADRDLILLSGGVSMGSYDLVPDALRVFGAEIVFHKARQKPGKPLLFARREDQLFFGLPGNPLSCHFCFHRYVSAAVRVMLGMPGVRQVCCGRLTEAIRPKAERTFFVPAAASLDRQTRSWCLVPMPGVTSADVFHSCRANCYVHVPAGRNPIPAGDELSFSWLAGRQKLSWNCV